MENQERKKSYSDLECIVTSDDPKQPTTIPDRQSYWNAKFAVAPTPGPGAHPGDVQASDAPEAVVIQIDASSHEEEQRARDAKALFDSSPVDTTAPAPPAYFLVDSKGQTQALYTVPSSTSTSTSTSTTSSDAASIANFKGAAAAAAAAAAAPPPSDGGWWAALGEGKRICGLRKNVLLAGCAGACALVLGLLITILLVTRPRGSSSSSSAMPTSDGVQPLFATQMLLQRGDAGPLLAASDLAAMNWTADGEAYTGVFYQAAAATGASALMASVKNEADQMWTSVNISASAASGSSTPLDVLPGTPLAAASNNGLWNLYYLTSAGTVAELYSTNPLSAFGWAPGEFAAKLGAPEAAPGSGLAAMWQLCDDCEDALLVTWQNAQTNTLVYANFTNSTWNTTPTLIDNSPAPGTPVVVNAYTDSNRVLGSDKNAIRIYHTQEDGLRESIKGPLGSGKLIAGNSGKPITDGLTVTPPPKMAGLTYGQGEALSGWNNNLLAWINPFYGQLTCANYVSGAEWTFGEPTLDGSPDDLAEGGWSAVAMTQNMKIFLLSPGKGEIHEYSTNSTAAKEWVWETTVVATVAAT